MRSRTPLAEAAPSVFEEIDMEDFPIWLKLVIWGTIGLTVLYTIWGMLHSYLQA
jgi:hypothetical protein